jgi:hypothetical protein
MKNDLILELQSGQKTAKAAAAILVAKKVGFHIPTAKQRLNLLVAFAKRGKVVYGRAFDVVKLSEPVDLENLTEVEQCLGNVTVYEIKSTRKKLRTDFAGYFFGLTGAEVLVAQSLKKQFKFVLVNTGTREHVEMSLSEIFAPSWSICF